MARMVCSALCYLAVAVAVCGTAWAQKDGKPEPLPAAEDEQAPVKMKPGVANRSKYELPCADAPLPAPGGGSEPTTAGQVTYLSPDRAVGLLGVAQPPAPSPTPAPSSDAASFFDRADRRIVLGQVGARARSQVQAELRARGAGTATIVRGNLVEVLGRVARCAFVVRAQPTGAGEPREETVIVEVPVSASQAEVLQRIARS